MLNNLSKEDKQYIYLFVGIILCLAIVSWSGKKLANFCKVQEKFTENAITEEVHTVAEEKVSNVVQELSQEEQEAIQEYEEIISNMKEQEEQETINDQNSEKINQEDNVDPLIVMQELYKNLKIISDNIKEKKAEMESEITKLEKLSSIVQQSDKSSGELSEHLVNLDKMKDTVEYLKVNKDTITETIQKVTEMKVTLDNSQESSENIKAKLDELTQLSKTVTDQVHALKSSEVASLNIGNKLEVGPVIIDAQGNISGGNSIAFNTTGKFMSLVTNKPDTGGVEFRHTNKTQGIGLGYNTLYATGTHANQDIGLKARGHGHVKLHSNTIASGDVDMKKNLNVEGSIKFKNNNNNTDKYRLEKLHHSRNQSELRFTLEDDASKSNNEKLTIYGKGGKKHEFNTLGNASHTGDLLVEKNLSVNKKIKLGDNINANDPYFLEKISHGNDKSSLRLTINDNSDEKFEIWGNSCGSKSGCGGPGELKHTFDASGGAYHTGNLNVQGNTNLKSGVKGLGTHLPYTDGTNYISGKTLVRGGILESQDGMYTKGGKSEHNPKNWGSHFPYTDGNNYIRGNTIVTGNITTVGNLQTNSNLCIGSTCISSDQFIKMKKIIENKEENSLYDAGFIRHVYSTGGNPNKAAEYADSGNRSNRKSLAIQTVPINYLTPIFNGIKDNMYIRWEGFIKLPYSINVTIVAIGDDGVRINFRGQGFKTNGWKNQPPKAYYTNALSVTKHVRYPIKFEYYQGGGGSTVMLLWNVDGNGSTTVVTGNVVSNIDQMLSQGWHPIQLRFCSHLKSRYTSLTA